MRIFPFQATYPHLDLIPSPDSFFSSIKHEYGHYRSAGFFSKRPSDAIFIQEIITPHGSHKGIIAKNDLHDFNKGKILKHENTLDAKEQSMMNFMLQTKAMVKPILLAYHGVDEINAFIDDFIGQNLPFQTTQFQSGEIHRFWEITDGVQIDFLQNLFQKHVTHSYIADGHHRCATMLKLLENSYLKSEGVHVEHIFAAYYSFSNLTIFDYNRIVDVSNISMVKLMAKLSKYCRIKYLKHGGKPAKKHTLHLYYLGHWYAITWKRKLLKGHAHELLLLDASLLNTYLFDKILKINDVRIDPRISYSEGVSPIKDVVMPLKKDSSKFVIFLAPLDATDLRTAAENNISLPPKSTWFEPRIKSGLLVQEF